MSPSGRPALRSFLIDGEQRTDTTYRTGLIAHYTTIRDRTFLDLGAGEGYESRALAIRGARAAVAVEGKDRLFEMAQAAQEHLQLSNHEVQKLDVRRIDEYGLPTFDVVLCFGFLYHMTNPFNVLKRIRAVTGELLLIETHVAPRVLHGLRDLHMQTLPWSMHAVTLDGVRFEGRIVPHVGVPEKSRGGLDNPWSFWLTSESLIEAVTRAGFRIEEFYTESDPTTPEAFRATAEDVSLNRFNTKVWVVATPRPGAAVEAGDPVEQIQETLSQPSTHAALAYAARRFAPSWMPPIPSPVRRVARRLRTGSERTR